jgi:hypothetical protein
MDYPPIFNLALSCQIEVKGERSRCRMTHIPRSNFKDLSHLWHDPN